MEKVKCLLFKLNKVIFYEVSFFWFFFFGLLYCLLKVWNGDYFIYLICIVCKYGKVVLLFLFICLGIYFCFFGMFLDVVGRVFFCVM